MTEDTFFKTTLEAPEAVLDSSKEAVPRPESESRSYLRAAPTLDDVAASGNRNNALQSEGRDIAQFTEQQGIENLRIFF